MSDFVEAFRRRFMAEYLVHWQDVLAFEVGGEPPYLTLRLVPLVALTDGVDAGVVALRQAIASARVAPAAPLDVSRNIIETALGLCNLALVEDPSRPARTRPIVDLMLDLKNLTLRPLASAFAAVIHARAGDDRLAALRLGEVRSAPRGGASPGGELDALLTHSLARYASTLTGAPYDDAPPLALSPEGEAQATLWGWLLHDAPDAPLQDQQALADVVRLLPPPIVPAVIASLPGAVFDCALATGRGHDLRPLVEPALEVAEELIWATTERRSLLWGRVAMTWLAIGRPERAIAAVNEAERNVAAEIGRLKVYEQLTLAADLLDVTTRVEVMSPAPAEERVDPEPAGLDPRELRDLGPLLGSGTTVLVAGAALPEARGAASVVDLLRTVVRWGDEADTLTTSPQSLLTGIDQGQLNQVGAALRAGRVPLEAMVQEAYAALAGEGLYGDLARIPFASVLTLAWDPQLLEAFAARDPLELHVGSPEVLEAAKSQRFAFTWLAGDPSREPVAIGMRDVRSRLYNDETLSRYLTGLLDASPLLFLGLTAAEVVEFLDTVLPFVTSTSPSSSSSGPVAAQPRFAVCPIDDLWDLSKAQLRDDYGVSLIGYPAGDPEALARVVRLLAGDSGAGPAAAAAQPAQRTQPALARIRLENIGAFERLDLRLSETWNLLLGNNGCGKSTVLRAVALGLCGDHPQAVQAGASLLRAGTTRGSIELEVGPTRYNTELVRSGNAVRVRTTSLTPLQQGNWAVLGFPALRGLSVGTGSGISSPQAPEPRVEDLLPLLRGEVDHRMDDIKQWIINIVARAKEPEQERWSGLLTRFFEVVKALTPGGTLEFESADPGTWEVWVRTDDGIVPIDQLSQGMSSIIAWVGNLLQRMYDIYPASPNPSHEVAFVLIDELDAHLHPEWQRLVPGLTRKHFPHVQFLATSHSPLIASSLRQGELFVARRIQSEQPDGSERLVATIRQEDLDPKGLRADQILTSPLFSMETSRSPEFVEDVDRYSELMVASSRTPAEESEMARLRERIAHSYRDGETAQERQHEVPPSAEQVHAQLGDLDPAQIAQLKEFAAEATTDPPAAGAS